MSAPHFLKYTDAHGGDKSNNPKRYVFFDQAKVGPYCQYANFKYNICLFRVHELAVELVKTEQNQAWSKKEQNSSQNTLLMV